MRRLVYMSIAVLFLLPLWSMQVSAGEVNSAESALVAIGQGQYEYDGAIYAFKSEYQTKLYNYLSRDDVDLSQSQVNDYVSQFYGNLASACTSQYMYKVSDVEKPSPAPTPAEPSPAPVIPGETDTPVETEAAGEETNTEEPAGSSESRQDKNTDEEATAETEPEETEGGPVTLPAAEEKPVVLETETVPETEIAETEEKKDYSHAERVDNRFRFEMVIGVIVVAAVVVLLLLVAGKTAKKKKWHRD